MNFVMQNIERDLAALRKLVELNADRVRIVGEWPAWIQSSSLLDRIPRDGELASGFDAGIACALDLIPRNKQHLSAKLHANYTPDAVQQVRDDFKKHFALNVQDSFADSETAWWLSACYVCREGGVSQQEFMDQISVFSEANEKTRQHWALAAWKKMSKSYTVVDNVALALEDGGMQAAYVQGYDLAIQPMHGIWFAGTYKASLGISEDFKWGMSVDEMNRPLSGPVHGSKQFVKCATFDELTDVIRMARLSGLGTPSRIVDSPSI